jgi:hypothetical protein
MHDPTTVLVVNLDYASILGIGFLMFLGHVAAFIVLLAGAATAKPLTKALRALVLRLRNPQPIGNSAVAISRGSRLPLIPSTVSRGSVIAASSAIIADHIGHSHQCWPVRNLAPQNLATQLATQPGLPRGGQLVPGGRIAFRISWSLVGPEHDRVEDGAGLSRQLRIDRFVEIGHPDDSAFAVQVDHPVGHGDPVSSLLSRENDDTFGSLKGVAVWV